VDRRLGVDMQAGRFKHVSGDALGATIYLEKAEL
jgi:hypothetical protein